MSGYDTYKIVTIYRFVRYNFVIYVGHYLLLEFVCHSTADFITSSNLLIIDVIKLKRKLVVTNGIKWLEDTLPLVSFEFA